ncbi:MAG: hypothetical protein ABIQ12_06220 [Opitutaceae bacterium]
MMLSVACAAAQIEFVGVMTNSKETFFVLRAGEASRTRWVTVGERFGGYVVKAYDASNQALTLERGTERIVLSMPGAQVRLAPDEVVAGMRKILNNPGAEQLFDMVHPKLRPLLKPADFESGVFSGMLAPGAKFGIRDIAKDEADALQDGLDDVEKVVGVRPKHGFWISDGNGFGMSFVVLVGDAWYLAPSVPRKD